MFVKRINFYLDNYSYIFLKERGKLSEQIRNAVREYITKLKVLTVSASQSKRKDGE